MVRVKRGVVVGKRHKKVLKLAKSYYSARSRTFKSAKQSIIKAGQYSYRDRRKRISNFRCTWIQNLNKKVRSTNINYSKFIRSLKNTGILLDRKILSSNIILKSNVFFSLLNVLSKKGSESEFK